MIKYLIKQWRKNHSKFMVLDTIEELGAYKCPKCKGIISIYDIHFTKVPVKTENFTYSLDTSFCPKCGQKVVNRLVKINA